MRKFSSISRVVCLGAGLWLGAPLFAFENSSRLLTYKDRDQTLFALSLATDAATNPRAQLRVAILVDTSASQSGAYRTDSMEIAERFIQSLPKNAEAALFSCDTEARLLAKGKVSGTELVSGLKTLSETIPLGSSDIVTAVRKAKSVLAEGNDGKDLCIVYVGDGIHRFNLLQPKGFESLVNELRNDRTTILSLAIGPQLDVEFLATLANHTGGSVFVHQNLNNLSNQQVADGLAKACAVPVFWPSESSFPKSVAAHYPVKLPPIRGDRDSIVLGKLESEDASGELVIHGSWGAATSKLVWNIRREAQNEDLAFLGEVVEKAELNSGLTLPTAGSEALMAFGNSLLNSSDQLLKDARFALASGDREAAIAIATKALKISPNDPAAKAVLEAASKVEIPVAAPKVEPKKNDKDKTSSNQRRNVVRFVSAQVGDDPFGGASQPPAQGGNAGGDPFGDDAAANPPAGVGAGAGAAAGRQSSSRAFEESLGQANSYAMLTKNAELLLKL